MSTLDDIMLIEGDSDASEEEQLAAWQRLLDDGMVWKLQGSYGRTASALIERGLIHRKVVN